MENLRRYAPAATIAGLIVGVWALFRKTGDITTVNNNQAPITFPNIGATPLDIPDHAGSSGGTNSGYNRHSRQNPLDSSPGGGLLPGYLTSNLAPWNNGVMQYLYGQAGSPSDSGAGGSGSDGGGGCSGGCSGCASQNSCSSPAAQNKMLDGSGSCFATPSSRKMPVTHGQAAQVQLYAIEQSSRGSQRGAAGD